MDISLCLQIVYVCKYYIVRFSDYVTTAASKRTQFFSWRPDAGVLEAGRGQSRRKTRASWRTDAGALQAGRGQSGRKTRALWRQDAGRRGVKLFLGSTVYYFEITIPCPEQNVL
jgi:hypothetical protein